MTVDLSKVSKAVRQFVDSVKELEGSKKKIDSKKEYDELSNYLAGNTNSMNIHEKEFIQGFMLEYEKKSDKQAKEAEQKRLEDATTENTKEAVKDIKKWTSDKRKIDSDAEAQALAAMLKNTAGDLNSTDIEYIKKVLTESGYGAYIPKEDTKTEQQTAPKQEEKPASQEAKTETPETPKEQQAENNTGTTKDTPQQTEKPATEAPKTEHKEESAAPAAPKRRKAARPARRPHIQVEAIRTPGTPSQKEKEAKGASSNEVISDKPEIKQKEINKPVNQPKAKAQKKYQITEIGRNKGLKLAGEVKKELAAGVTDNERLVNLLKSVGASSAYSFVGQFANMRGPQLNQQVFSVSDILDKIDYNATLHVMKKLLEQAKTVGLAGTPAYNNLQRVITTGETNLKNRTLDDGDPNERTQVEADKAISWLYNEMSKVIK